METAVERAVGAGMIVAGLSHLLHPDAWSDFFAAVRRTGQAPFLLGLIALTEGVILLALHPRWTAGGGSVITLLGWGLALKGTSYLLAPRLGDRVISTAESPRLRQIGFRLAGLALMVLGGVAVRG